MKTNTAALAKALAALAPVASKRTTLPVLNTVRVEAKNGVLTLQATNLECHVSLDVECTGRLEAACVPARVFRNVVGFGLDTELSLVKGRLHVKTESSAIEIPVLDAAEFPACLEVKEAPLAVDCAALATAIEKAGYAFSTEQDRVALQSVMFEATGGKMHICTTDGRRAVRAVIDCDAEVKFAVPSAEISPILTALHGDNPSVRISQNWIRVDHDDGFSQAKLSEALVNFLKVIPSKVEPFGNVSRTELIAALDMCSGFTTDMVFAINVEPKKDGIALSVKSEAGAVDTEVKASIKPMPMIRVNPDHFRVMLRHLEGDTVPVGYVDPKSPLLITEGNITAFIMPLLKK